MWKDYSSGYIKNNRSSGMSVMIAAFISALLLSLLLGLFYNAWKYEMESIEQEAQITETTAPGLLFPMAALIVGIASFSLIIIIHHAFAVSMDARIHQLGILSSIGATPKQIRSCLLQEAAVLCVLPIFGGNLMGIFICRELIHMTNRLVGDSIPGRHEAIFGYHPLVLAVTLFLMVMTIWISAWIPARKLSRLAPLEAIKNTNELQLKHKSSAPFLTLLFGMEGELAGNAVKAQRKALRTASLSLLLSFLAFTMMQSVLTLSAISTRETYFERYQSVWDIMVTVKDIDVDSFSEPQKLQEIPEIRSAIVYQRAVAKRLIAEDEISEEMKAFGGFAAAGESDVRKTDKGWLVNVPIVILDDASFLAYCEQIGIAPRLDGAVIWNQIRDVTNPDFKHPQYVPYVKTDISAGENAASMLSAAGNEKMTVEIPVLSYTEQTPALREEYAKIDYYELVHFLPVSMWKEIKEQIGGSEEDTYICMLARENVTLEELDALQGQTERLLAGDYEIESENRIREAEVNDIQIQGLMTLFGSFCVLLAVIGIGNVFSNTLGFVRQRKREYARYLSVGMTQGEMKKMFCVEALIIAGRPIAITCPLAVVIVGCMLRAGYIEARTFLAEAPLVPIAVFMLAIWGTVALAYYLGWRNLRKINLAEVLRDDTMM